MSTSIYFKCIRCNCFIILLNFLKKYHPRKCLRALIELKVALVTVGVAFFNKVKRSGERRSGRDRNEYRNRIRNKELKETKSFETVLKSIRDY